MVRKLALKLTGMILNDFAAHPSLNEFVQCFRIVHFKFKSPTAPVVKAYSPRPEVCLHFFLRERELIQHANGPKEGHHFPVVLAGQQTSTFNRYLLGNDFITFNIVFQPAAFFRLTGISSLEVTDKHLNAELIFFAHTRSILEQLQNAVSYEEMIRIGEHFVESLVRRARKDAHHLDRVSRLMVMSGSRLSLEWLASQSCLSPRQFSRKFAERTGVSAKTFLRIIRIAKAINFRNAYPSKDWLQIASECGYFDYQHLAKDYREFTHHKPNDFHQLETSSPEHILGLTNEVYRRRAEASILLT